MSRVVLFIYILLLYLVSICKSQMTATLTIHEPFNYAVYAIRPPAESSNVGFRYDIFGADKSLYQICIRLSNTKDQSEVLPFTCLETSQSALTLQKIPPGSFTLYAVLKEIQSPSNILYSTETLITIYIKHISEILPKLTMSTKDIILKHDQTTSDISIHYSIEQSSIINELELCVKAITIVNTQQHQLQGELQQEQQQEQEQTNEILPLTCIKEYTNVLNLYNIPQGSYQISLLFRQKASPFTLFSSSEIQSIVNIKHLIDALPMILVESYLEFGIPTGATSTSISFKYQLQGHQDAANQVQVCIELSTSPHEGEVTSISDPAAATSTATTVTATATAAATVSTGSHSESNTIILPLTCLDRSKGSNIQLNGITAGSYTIKLILRQDHEPFTVYDATATYVQVEVRHMTEFSPTYDWQPLHSWETIPRGLETRLPMSGSELKQAKIPEPWRLQVPMPSPCKHFLRMDVFKHTTIKSLKEEASKLCQQPAGCFLFYADDALLSDDETALSSGLFGRRIALEFASTCSS